MQAILGSFKASAVCVILRYSNLILNLFSLMVDANIPDIALEPDKTVKKVCLLLLAPLNKSLYKLR